MFDTIIIPFDRSKAARQIRKDELDYARERDYEPFFFTFGFGQAFPNGVACIWAPDRGAAREKMGSLFGTRWSFDYDLESMADYVSKYGGFMVGEYVVD